MKTLRKFTVLLLLSSGIYAQPTFTITFNSGTNIITCNQPVLAFSASNGLSYPYTYIWASASNTLTGASVNVSIPDIYSVAALDSMNNQVGTQTLSVMANTTAPTSVLSPTYQNIFCNSSITPVTSAASGNNLSHKFISPYGGIYVSNTPTASYSAFGPGTYTHVLKDNLTGCESISSFSINASQTFPTYSLVSAQNFALGCGTKSVATINVINATTNPPGGPVTYTLISPGAALPPSTGTLAPITSYTVNNPGTYIIYVRDNTSFCTTSIPLSILSNTIGPNFSVQVPRQILTCDSNQTILHATSTQSNVNINWTFMGAPGTIAGSTLQVNTNSLVPTQTLINIYTLTVQDMNNSCANQSVIPIYQNTFKPIPGISTGGNTTITCASPTIILTNTSSSGIPIGSGFPVHLVVSSYLWEGPAPVPPAAMSSTYIVYTAGTYTMFIKDLNNGCTASKTVNITGGCNLVGLEDNLNNTLSVYMYPNPTKGIVTLQSNYSEKNIVVELYNSLGMLVKKQLLQAPESHLNFSECASGIYFVYLKDKDVVLHRAKLIKE